MPDSPSQNLPAKRKRGSRKAAAVHEPAATLAALPQTVAPEDCKTSPAVEASSCVGHRNRLRERFCKNGFEGFLAHESLELLLTLCVHRKDVKPTAHRLLRRFGSVKGVLDAPLDQLTAVEGVGEITAVSLRIIKAFSALYLKQTAQQQPLLNSVDALTQLFQIRMAELRNEVFEVAFLDKAYRLQQEGVLRLSSGIPDRAVVYPRQIVEVALQQKAVYIVVAHNHPAGTLKPSPEDIHLTALISRSADVIGVKLLDHIIVTPTSSFSFSDEGLMP